MKDLLIVAASLVAGGFLAFAIGGTIIVANYRLIDRDLWERMCDLLDEKPRFDRLLEDEA